MPVIYLVILCGVLSVAYAIWATRSVLAADQGNARMQEISAAIREGAQAYLTRQYTTIAIVGVVVFVLAWWLLSGVAALGFLIGAVLSGVAGFIGMHVRCAPMCVRRKRVEQPGRRSRYRLQVRRYHRHAGCRPRLLGVSVYFAALVGPMGYFRTTVSDRRSRVSRLRRFADLDLRPSRRRYLHQGRRRRRRPRRQGEAGIPKTIRATRPRSPTMSATMSATAPAWPPTCSRPMR
jgi:hypothetical protein